MNIMTEIKATISDFYKYLNTTIPEGVDGQLFTDLLYTNRSRIVDFEEAHPEIDRRLLENIAVNEYLRKSEEEILEDCKIYGVERECRNYKMTSHTSSENTSKL